eukprot:SAG11_NODE_1191_length_5572_cov_1.714364_3_plen_106_part_00
MQSYTIEFDFGTKHPLRETKFIIVCSFLPQEMLSPNANDLENLKTADQQPNLDLSQLAQLNIDPVFLQFIGSVVTKVVPTGVGEREHGAAKQDPGLGSREHGCPR